MTAIVTGVVAFIFGAAFGAGVVGWTAAGMIADLREELDRARAAGFAQ